MLQISISAEWASVLIVLLLAPLGWAWRLQDQLNKIRTELAVNTAKDEAINGSIAEMKADISWIKKNVSIIMEFMAAEKALRENGKK